MSAWTFITNPNPVMALIAQRDQITVREIIEIAGWQSDLSAASSLS